MTGVRKSLVLASRRTRFASPVGVGIDIVDIARVERMLARGGARMMDRVLTDVEQHYCKTQAVPAQHVAARLAAKEAAFKALQAAGARAYVGWREIEVRREAVGAPTLAFHQRAKECAETLGVVGALVSLSHSNTHAVAVVLLWA